MIRTLLALALAILSLNVPARAQEASPDAGVSAFLDATDVAQDDVPWGPPAEMSHRGWARRASGSLMGAHSSRRGQSERARHCPGLHALS